MTKVPNAGNVKTRLEKILSPDERASLAECFLLDTVKKAKRVPCEKTIVAFSPPEGAERLTTLLPAETICIEQRGANLGDRMAAAFEEAFAIGAAGIVMIGTDSPTLPADYIEQAFEHLETSSDAVLGRAEDGGFYLIGLRRPAQNEIFAGVEWSSPRVFERVFENVHRADLHLRETPGWYDVDEPRDLFQLKEELAHNENARRRAPHTFEWMKNHLI